MSCFAKKMLRQKWISLMSGQFKTFSIAVLLAAVGAVAAIRSTGAGVKFLPLYSPDLNPIEKIWSKIKAVLRAIGARTSAALHRAIRKALRLVTPQDAASWFSLCGYTIY